VLRVPLKVIDDKRARRAARTLLVLLPARTTVAYGEKWRCAGWLSCRRALRQTRVACLIPGYLRCRHLAVMQRATLPRRRRRLHIAGPLYSLKHTFEDSLDNEHCQPSVAA